MKRLTKTSLRIVPPAAADAYDTLHGHFRWQVPAHLNLAELCCSRWARDPRTASNVAVAWENEGGASGELRYAELQAAADRLSHGLQRLGVQRGDRVAIVMPQRPETAIAQIAVHQLGAVAMPLSMLFGPEALAYRLQDSAAGVAIADESSMANLQAARAECPALRTVLAAGAAQGQGDLDWADALAAHHMPFPAVDTHADDPAILIYTSGTTGPPKGALLPQRALIGNLSGFVCSHNFYPAIDSGSAPQDKPNAGAIRPLSLGKGERGKGGDRSSARRRNTQSVFWSPADWAWTGGLMDALLPALYFGQRIVAWQGRFSPEQAFGLMERHGVTHTFLFPTALKAMMKALPAPRQRYRLKLQSIMSAGEAVGDTVFHWAERALGVRINEMFGQTEINYIVGNCGRYLGVDHQWHAGWPQRPGSMGRAYPGHRVAVIDDAGGECPRGTPGDVALHRLDPHGEPDPIFFLGYWGRDDATAAKFTGPDCTAWCRTGDTAVMDADGYLWYQGRSDDVFKAAGYRIGPSEIENCLVNHPAVANAAVVPKPDAERGAVVKAYVVLAAGHRGDVALVQVLQQHVRGRLASYEYPKEIEFIDSLPMTTTGKVQRRVLRLQEEERARRPPPPETDT
ncbi:MAG: AMP-binding protein [Pseudomonadota bacterium]|nr:AMP-binding protein [Pseudomonadota bacterium]